MLSQFQNVLDLPVKKLFFKRQTISDAAAVFFLKKHENHVSGRSPLPANRNGLCFMNRVC